MRPSKLEFFEKAAAVCLFIRGIAVATNIITSTALVGAGWGGAAGPAGARSWSAHHAA
jgi:hypothetical protein